MRVLIISSLYGVRGGGAGIMVQHLARGLSNLGDQVAIITIGESKTYSVAQGEGIRIYRFRPWNIYPFEEKDNHPVWQKPLWQIFDIYNFHSSRVIEQIIGRENPDIIHVHKMRGFSSAVWSTATRLHPGRIVQTCHDYESISPDGLMRGAIGRMALNKQWPVRGYQLIRARLSTDVSAVTAPSSFTLNRILESGLFPFSAKRIIPNTHGWSEQQLKMLHQKTDDDSGKLVRFLFLGRLEREKGILELCEAFLRASKKCYSIILDVAGWGTLASELRETYGKYSNMYFLGAIDGKTKENTLQKASVVVVPSLVDEVFGLSVVEAFAYGKPVIASNAGGLPELVEHGKTGWIVEPGNVQALAEQLEFVAAIKPTLTNKMSQSCKEFSYKYTVERVLKKYLALYDQLLA